MTVDLPPRWTIQKNPPRFPIDPKFPWVVYETAARVHGTPLLERFSSCSAAKVWAVENAPQDTEVVVLKRLKRPCLHCGRKS